ncbi:unnamed protein product [Didymodactylos carnosus]|uniref:SWIM-type domain-containing protein n=1 Tax=Didymodactylos carnosus TaxID=1234261 RepID=A0A814GVV1_9BILA|nr:unnamed protein product [Didymodactylos carnosus]CAF3772799.1 unnamed protein product [Didymodactylos carnosus]
MAKFVKCREVLNIIRSNSYSKLPQLPPDIKTNTIYVLQLNDNTKGDLTKAILRDTPVTPKSIVRLIDQRVKYQEPSTVYRELISSAVGVSTVKNPRQVRYLFRHNAFHEYPSIVLCYIIHESKQQQCHIELVRFIKDQCPELDKKSIIVTDNEKAFKNCFASEFPNMIQLRCWNHLFKNIFRRTTKYLKSNKTNEPQTASSGENLQPTTTTDKPPVENDEELMTDDMVFYMMNENLNDEHDYCKPMVNDVEFDIIISIPESKKQMARRYVNDLKFLLSQNSSIEFEIELSTLLKTWTDDFIEYFNKYIYPDINELGIWTVKEKNIEHLFNDSITSNMIEGVNFVYKSVTEWKMITLDRAVIIFNYLQGYYINEVQRGYCGLGGYTLKEEYAKLKMDKSLLVLLQSYDPHEIVQQVKQLELDFKSPDGSDSGNLNKTPSRPKPLSQQELALQLVNSERVKFIENLGIFTVENMSRSQVHNVDIKHYPAFNCTCELSKKNKKINCVHILAVKRKMNISLTTVQVKQNCGLLRKARNKEAGIGITGRKKPNEWDKEKMNGTIVSTHKGVKISANTTPKRVLSTSDPDTIIQPAPPPKRLAMTDMTNTQPVCVFLR